MMIKFRVAQIRTAVEQINNRAHARLPHTPVVDIAIGGSDMDWMDIGGYRIGTLQHASTGVADTAGAGLLQSPTFVWIRVRAYLLYACYNAYSICMPICGYHARTTSVDLCVHADVLEYVAADR